jgi:predicted ester cyclase
MPDGSVRYTKIGITPPLKANNLTRFRSFIDRINRHQWGFLSEVVQGRILYNNRALTLYEFTQLLKQEFARKSNVTMEVVTAVGGGDALKGPVCARLCVKALVAEGLYLPSAPRRLSEYARHMCVHFTGRKISQLYDISDDSKKHDWTEIILPPPSLRPPPALTSIDLRRFYAGYINCINSGRAAEELNQFCKTEGIVWNGTNMTVQQYGEMIRSSIHGTSRLFVDIHTLAVDENRQQLAARLVFTGAPVKPFARRVPNGQPVTFSEHVFYRLEQGKISHVLSIVDWD